jgi:predicted 3-demethylubiquinone-9 3-methyltransferase (glyoxalase superfamily)
MCGWLKDKYGVFWQVTPRALLDMEKSKDRAAARRAVQAMMTMKKLDIAALKKAFEG